jgi:hypothetical protein
MNLPHFLVMGNLGIELLCYHIFAQTNQLYKHQNHHTLVVNASKNKETPHYLTKKHVAKGCKHDKRTQGCQG